MKLTMTRRRLLTASGAFCVAAAAYPGGALAAAPRNTASGHQGEFVIRGASLVTMDPALGNLSSGDVHVRSGAIVAVQPKLDVSGIEVIDGRGMIAMPGLVDA